jgi:hypothetical protein
MLHWQLRVFAHNIHTSAALQTLQEDLRIRFLGDYSSEVGCMTVLALAW